MHEENYIQEHYIDHDQPLQKHKYPAPIILSAILVFAMFLYSCSHFFFYEFSNHYEMNTWIKDAENYFLKEDYGSALKLYMSILKVYPEFRDGRIRAAQCCFAISNLNKSFATHASIFLDDTITPLELIEIQKYMPEEDKKEFSKIYFCKKGHNKCSFHGN